MFWSVEEVVGKKEEGRKKSKGTCVEEKKKKGKKLMKYGWKEKKEKNKKLKLRNTITIFLQYFHNKS